MDRERTRRRIWVELTPDTRSLCLAWRKVGAISMWNSQRGWQKWSQNRRNDSLNADGADAIMGCSDNAESPLCRIARRGALPVGVMVNG